jgi:hypothetical protein
MNEKEKYSDARKHEAAPPAGPMMESLRDLGYATETAVADIIDNAIFAKAKNIHIDFIWRVKNSRIVLRDSGTGMSEVDLIEAMRPGNQSPSKDREASDLGRFGLGLKTASLSQCRTFTVLSRKKGQALSYWRWDLDYVTDPEQGGWTIIEAAEKEDVEVAEGMTSGTMVSWDYLDRVIDTDGTPSEKDFYATAARTKRHIEMVFHRYLETGKLQIIFNDKPVVPWDPFLRGESATQPFPEEYLGNGDVRVKAYILPHRSRISPEVWTENEDRGGWNALQGFYIYRNERLLLAADWLGIGKKMPHYKLARIMIDLPNHLDEQWQIDIKKSRARPPYNERQNLKAIGLSAMSQAEQVFKHRGKVIQRAMKKEFSFVWEGMEKDGRYFFRINREHPLIAAQLEKFPGKAREIQKLLRLIEETVPGPNIIAKESDLPDSLVRPFEKAPPEEILNMMKELYKGWLKLGNSKEIAKNKLLMIEPFSDYPQLIETLTDD